MNEKGDLHLHKNYIIMKKTKTGIDEMVGFEAGFTAAYAFIVRNGLTEYYIAKVLKFDNVVPQ